MESSLLISLPGFRRCEQAFILALMEMVVNGVSTRKVEPITRELAWRNILQIRRRERVIRIFPDRVEVSAYTGLSGQ